MCRVPAVVLGAADDKSETCGEWGLVGRYNWARGQTLRQVCVRVCVDIIYSAVVGLSMFNNNPADQVGCVEAFALNKLNSPWVLPHKS